MSPTSQATNQPTMDELNQLRQFEQSYEDWWVQHCQVPPLRYVAVRINYPHDKDGVLKSAISDEVYCYYKHLGKTGENPHYHLCFPIEDGVDPVRVTERIRKKLKTKLDLKGNKQISCKSMDNGVLSFIQYASREGTTASHRGHPAKHPWMYWIARAPKWEAKVVQKTIVGVKRPRDPDVPKQLTYANMKRAALRHRLRYNLKTTDLAEVLGHMHDHDDWDLSIMVYKGGIPNVYRADFENMCKHQMSSASLFKRLYYDPLYAK